MSNHWHLNLKSAPKGTWILSVLHGLMQSIDTVGVSYFTLINQCKNTNTLADDTDFLISILNGFFFASTRGLYLYSYEITILEST